MNHEPIRGKGSWLQAYGQSKSAELGLTVDDVPEVTRRVLKGRA